MSIEVVKCPQCGENASIDNKRDFGFCSYCGFKIENQKPAPSPTEAPTADSLLTRAELFLEEKNYEKADEYFNKVLDINPKNSRAYWGMLICKTSALNIEKSAQKPQNIEDFNEYKNAVRFAENEEIRQFYIDMANKFQSDIDLKWADREQVIQQETKIQKEKHEQIRKEDLKASIRRLKTLITLVDVFKTIHGFASAICIIAALILFFMTIADFEMALLFIPLLTLTGFAIGGIIGLDKLSDGLYRMMRARTNTLESMETE